MSIEAKKRWRTAGLIIGPLLILGGLGGCQATEVDRWACLGSWVECDASYIPTHGWIIGISGCALGFALLALAMSYKTPTEQRENADNRRQELETGVRVIRETRERDNGKCRECGTSETTGVFFASRVSPAGAAREDVSQMVVLCNLHAGWREPVYQSYQMDTEP